MHTWDWDFSYHVQKQWKYLLLECILNVFSFVILSYISINSNVYQVQQQQLYWQNRRHFKVSFCPLTALRSKKKKKRKKEKTLLFPVNAPGKNMLLKVECEIKRTSSVVFEASRVGVPINHVEATVKGLGLNPRHFRKFCNSLKQLIKPSAYHF